MSEAEGQRRNFYGRVHGKTLRVAQKAALAELLGPLTLPGVTRAVNPSRLTVDPTLPLVGPCGWRWGLAGAKHLAHMAGFTPRSRSWERSRS